MNAATSAPDNVTSVPDNVTEILPFNTALPIDDRYQDSKLPNPLLMELIFFCSALLIMLAAGLHALFNKLKDERDSRALTRKFSALSMISVSRSSCDLEASMSYVSFDADSLGDRGAPAPDLLRQLYPETNQDTAQVEDVPHKGKKRQSIVLEKLHIKGDPNSVVKMTMRHLEGQKEKQPAETTNEQTEGLKSQRISLMGNFDPSAARPEQSQQIIQTVSQKKRESTVVQQSPKPMQPSNPANTTVTRSQSEPEVTDKQTTKPPATKQDTDTVVKKSSEILSLRGKVSGNLSSTHSSDLGVTVSKSVQGHPSSSSKMSGSTISFNSAREKIALWHMKQQEQLRRKSSSLQKSNTRNKSQNSNLPVSMFSKSEDKCNFSLVNVEHLPSNC